eukprot:scaffold12343_cov77-Skeletonema_dohrnii-CCMP3373.AAC.5
MHEARIKGQTMQIQRSEGCTNQVVKGGVCIKHTAAKIALKVCSSDGYKNCAQKEGVCRRLGAKRLKGQAMQERWMHKSSQAWRTVMGANYVTVMDVQTKSSRSLHEDESQIKMYRFEGCTNTVYIVGNDTTTLFTIIYLSKCVLYIVMAIE